MQIQIQLNQVIMKEQSMQLILMGLIIFMVNIMFIHFFMEYQVYQQQIHVCIKILIFFRTKKYFFL